MQNLKNRPKTDKALKEFLKKQRQEDINKLLEVLGNTPKEIAKNLTRLGIKGFPTQGHACPIANYLSKKIKSSSWSVSAYSVYRTDQHDSGFVPPVAIRDFIRKFDDGEFPKLNQYRNL